jgi:hypothetical protein
MKNQKQITIALLFSTTQAGMNGFNSPYNILETYPKPNGSAPVMSSAAKTTVTCLQCIRSGWVWCSTKWHYSNAVDLTDGTEK